MKTKIYNSLPFFFLALLLCFGFTQKQALRDFRHYRTTQLSAGTRMEKIYVQTDKTFYRPGETIWFSLYLIDEGSHTPSDISDVVYVELINPKGNVVSTRRLPAVTGTAAGDFQLDHGYAGGIYTLKAYTRWMKNFGENAYFTKELTVQKVITPKVLLKLEFEKEAYGSGDEVVADFSIRSLRDEPVRNFNFTYTLQIGGRPLQDGTMNTDEEGEARITFELPGQLETNDGLLNVRLMYDGFTESISRSVPIILNQIDLQFFPEGGTFTAGLPNRVAFKSLNEFGKPADVSGVIIDQSGQEVSTFESFHDGMGALIFHPEMGKQYRAKVLKPQGIPMQFLLPKVVADGIALQVQAVTEEAVNVQLHTLADRTIQVVAHQPDTVFFTEQVKLQAGENKLRIPTHGAYTGTALITVFDESGLPQNERLVLLNVHRQLNIQLETDKVSYAPGEPVALKIRTTDELDQAVPARLSLSVVNDRIISFADDKQDHLLSYLLLSSDLQGDLHQPTFYFDNRKVKAPQALDYVLMTHGWRTFSPQSVKTAAYQPEIINEVSGTIIHRRGGHPLKATVYAAEISPERKLVKMETDESGRFVVKGLNPAYDLAILATAPFKSSRNMEIRLDYNLRPTGNPQNTGSNIPERNDPIPPLIRVKIEESGEKEATAMNSNPTGELNLSLKEATAALQEVVVVGYGSVRKKDMMSSVVSVDAETLDKYPYTDIAGLVQGRVAGLRIVENSGMPGNSPSIYVRGMSSISNQRPLIVVDGIPLTSDAPQGNLSMENISSVEVVKGPEASALYGSRGVNGLILVTTNNAWWGFNHQINRTTYAQHIYRSDQFYQARKFYQPKFVPQSDGTRKDEGSTVFWAPDIRTDKTGEALIHFRNAQEISNYRISVEGISTGGKPGRKEQSLHTIQPLMVDTKIPPFLGFGDTLWLPLIVKNNTGRTINGFFEVDIPSGFQILNDLPGMLSVEKDSVHTEWIKLLVGDQAGRFNIKVGFIGEEHTDRQAVEVEILPIGFPVYASMAGYDHAKHFEFEINDPLPGSLEATFTGYTNILEELLDGIASIIREPYGCFEQTSSSTYPNILALHLIRETKWENPETEKKALEYIKKGYQRLLTFETRERGFEWFGKTPPHEGLTAYGLMEFHDMQGVYPGVDPDMIDRTVRWLLSRKDGKGSFTRSKKALDSFGRSNQAVSDAYITYAFTEIGRGNDVRLEFEKACQEAVNSQDAYRMALLANAALNLGEHERATQLIGPLLQNGDQDLQAEHSMVRGYGISLQVEIRALLLMALLKQDAGQGANIMKLVQYLSSHRQMGGFGSTQATILSLKALSAYAQFYDQEREGSIDIAINQQNIAREPIGKNSLKAVYIDQLADHFSSGKQSVDVRLTGLQQPIPYALNLSWRSLTPATAPNCKLALETRIKTEQINLGETLRMDISLRNKTAEGLPMSMAIVGIPAGLSVQPWQLKELQEKAVFDFYEVRDNYLILYYRQMAPEAVRSIQLDLKSESPGSFQAPASSAYLYYTPEDKHWVDGEQVQVRR